MLSDPRQSWADSGASIPHTHAQLYALPFVPAAVARERERFTAYWQRTQGRNLLEDVLQDGSHEAPRLDRNAEPFAEKYSRLVTELEQLLTEGEQLSVTVRDELRRVAARD